MAFAIPVPQAPTPRFRFNPTDRFTLGKRILVWKGQTAKGHLFEHVDNPGLVEDFSHEHVALLLSSGALIRDGNFYTVAAQLALSEAEVASIAYLPEEEQLEILQRAEYIQRYERVKSDKTDRRLRLARRRRERLGLDKVDPGEAEDNAIIDVVNAEMRRVDYAKALAAVRKKGASQRFGINGKFHEPVSARTVRRWAACYRDALAREGASPATALLALRPKYRVCGNRTPRLDFEAYKFVRKYAVLYASRERPSKRACHRRMAEDLDAFNADRSARGLSDIRLPSFELLKLHIAMMDRFFVDAQRKSLEKARAKFGPNGQGPDAERPLQRCEMDGWEVHLKTLLIQTGVYEVLSEKQREDVERIRMILSVVIDCATRCILAMRLTRTEDERAGIDALAMAMSDKTALARTVGARTTWHMYGGILGLFVDNGYASRFFRNAAVQSVIHTSVVPAALPWLRPFIERLFRTFDLQLMPLFSGRTFSNVVDAGDYDSDKLASLTVQELADAIVRFVVDVYHLLPHEGLRGECPWDAWERMTKATPPFPAPDKLKFTAVFGMQCWPKLEKHGLQALCLHCQSKALTGQLTKHGPGKLEIELRIHPEDAAYAVAKVGGGWARVTPIEEGYEGETVADVIAAMKLDAKRKRDTTRRYESTVLDALREIRGVGGSARRRGGIAEVQHSPEELAHATAMFDETLHASEPAENAYIPFDEDPETDPLTPLAEVGDGADDGSENDSSDVDARQSPSRKVVKRAMTPTKSKPAQSNLQRRFGPRPSKNRDDK